MGMADLMDTALMAAPMADMADLMEDMVATMARGRLRPPLMLSPVMDMAGLMEDMVATMARGRLRPLLLLSPAMAMDLMADLMVDMVDTEATAMESKHHLKEPSNQLSCCN